MEVSEEDFLNLKIISNIDPKILKIHDNPKIPYVSSLQILTNNFRLQYISEIIDYWRENKFDNKNLNDLNWMYLYCIKYGFLENLDSKNINIYGSWEYTDRKYNLKLTEADKYLSSLTPMTDEKIKDFLMNRPFDVMNTGVLNDGTHRCCAMIGRIIRNEKYINLYVNYR